MRVIMKPLRRTLVFFIFSVFLCGTVSARQIEWQSCMTSPYSDWFGTESSSPELLCGYLSVPLKYTDTGGDMSDENIPLVRLAMTKLPAKSKRKGSIIIISGGPDYPELILISVLTGRSQIFGNHGTLSVLIHEVSVSPFLP